MATVKTEQQVQKLLLDNILNKYIKENVGKNTKLSDYIQEKLEYYKSISENKYSQSRELYELEQEYNNKVNIIKTRWKLLKEGKLKCDHPVSTYYPDASGNNDSFYICDICSEEIQ